MEELGFTMKSLSIAAGLNDSYVRDMLMRKRQPTIDKFSRLAEVLRVSVSYLLGEDNNSAQQHAAQTDALGQLRSALLAFGVDRDDLGRAVSAVKVFVDDLDEQSSQHPHGGRPEPANPRHELAPSGKRPRQRVS